MANVGPISGISDIVCGMPSDMWVRFDGENKKRCPVCATYDGFIRTCIKCDKKFKPTCNSTHMCYECRAHTRYKENSFC
jgi:hypothetical protein